MTQHRLQRLFLDDRARRGALPLLAAALVALYAHYGISTDAASLNFREIMEDPDRHVGGRVVLAFYQVVGVGDGRFDARSWGRTAPVMGSLPGLREGSIVSVEGVLRADHRVDLVFGYVHRWRFLKKVVGVVTLAAVGWLFVRDWRRDGGGRAEEADPG